MNLKHILKHLYLTDGREVLSFNPKAKDVDDRSTKYLSVRELFGPDEKDNIYIMDAKNAGNIGRFLNVRF